MRFEEHCAAAKVAVTVTVWRWPRAATEVQS